MAALPLQEELTFYNILNSFRLEYFKILLVYYCILKKNKKKINAGLVSIRDLFPKHKNIN